MKKGPYENRAIGRKEYMKAGLYEGKADNMKEGRKEGRKDGKTDGLTTYAECLVYSTTNSGSRQMVPT